jgi:tRNA A-37 threonylcarbamoyl transferase component Bud32
LKRLHKLGVQHGDLNKYKILIQENCVTLIDFGCATQCHDPELLAAELFSLESKLHEPSG